MKKLYFILINIILLIALVISIDFCTFIVDFNKRFNSLIKEAKENLEYKNEEINNLPRFKYSLRQIHFKDYFDKIIKDENELSERISLPQNDNNKKSIIVFGCSFAEGVFLQADETLSGQLSKYTQRTAYNMGVSASSPSYMLYLSEYNKFYDLIKVQPEYIIYVIIPDHINRIYQNKYGIANIDHTSYIGYKEHNGKLVEDKIR